MVYSMTMAAASTLFLSRDLGIHSNIGGNTQFKVCDSPELNFFICPLDLNFN